MLTAVITAHIVAELTKPSDLSVANNALTFRKRFDFADGIGADQANQLWADRRTIAAAGNETLDLSGVLANIYGDSVTLTKVKALIIRALPTNANDVVVGGAVANPFATPFADPTDKIKVLPGGLLMLVAPDANGYAVTPGTGDQLLIANSGAGTGVDYEIILVGAQ